MLTVHSQQYYVKGLDSLNSDRKYQNAELLGKECKNHVRLRFGDSIPEFEVQ